MVFDIRQSTSKTKNYFKLYKNIVKLKTSLLKSIYIFKYNFWLLQPKTKTHEKSFTRS